MISINLLPPEKKENLQWVIHARRLSFFFVGSFFIIIIFIALLYSIASMLIIHYDSINQAVEDEKTSYSNRKVVGLEENIASLNKDLMLISKLGEKQKNSTLILEVLEEIMPQNIMLTRLSFNPEIKQVTMIGFSPTRSKYVLFEEALRSYKEEGVGDLFFKNIDFPIKNYINPANIEFSFTMDVNL